MTATPTGHWPPTGPHRQRSARDVSRRGARRGGAGRRRDPRLPVRPGRRGAGRGRRRRRGRGRGPRPGPAGRRAGGAEGQPLHAGRRHDLRLADPRRTGARPTTPPWSRRCAAPAPSRWARRTWTSSPWAARRRTRRSGRRATRATPARFRAAAAVVPPRPWRPGSPRSASARTPAAPSASRRPCAGWSG